MTIRSASSLMAAAVLASTTALAQSNVQTPSGTRGKSHTSDETPVTLGGCLQREADYRRTHDSGRGGVAGTGLGRGNEYVLINASRGTAPDAAIDCSFQGTTEAYELTGSRERELGPFVGRAVQVSGMLKKAKTEPLGPSG